MLSSFYLLALAGVGIGILSILIGAVVSVSRKPPWSMKRPRLADTHESDSVFLDVDSPVRDRSMNYVSRNEAKNHEVEQVV